MSSLKKIIVLACATDYIPQVHYFEKSFQIYDGWDVRIVGLGSKWESFRTKMISYKKALQNIDANQVVVCLDAHDAICVQDSTGFIEHFLYYQAPIVVGCEKDCPFSIHNRFIQYGCCPNIDKWRRFHKMDMRNLMYVNSGCIVGYAGELYQMFAWILDHKDFYVKDDQAGVGFYMNEFPHKVKFDIQNRLVYNDKIGRGMKIETSPEGGLKIPLPHLPYFLHFPGIRNIYYRTNYEKVCSHVLGMDEYIYLNDKRNRIYRWCLPIITTFFLVIMVLIYYALFMRCPKK